MREMLKPLAPDDIRSRRVCKLRPHAVLPGVRASLYIDNSVLLTLPPERPFEIADLNRGMTVPAHSFRATLRDEFGTVMAERPDDPARIAAQRSAPKKDF